MKGFDPKFRDFPDYIIGITREIWEDRRHPHACTINYSKGYRRPLARSVVTGNEERDRRHDGHAGTSFPTGVLLGKDVIWVPAHPRPEC